MIILDLCYNENAMIHLILFDIDGTLLLTGGAGKVAFNRAFQELFGVLDGWGETIPDGKTDPLIFQEIFRRVLKRNGKPREFDSLGTLYVKYFRKEIQHSPKFRLMPGVKMLLQRLALEKAPLLGIATGNLEETAWLKLARGRLDSFFSFGGFGSDSPDRAELTRAAIRRARKLPKRKSRPPRSS